MCVRSTFHMLRAVCAFVLLTILFNTRGHAAENEQYVLVLPGPTCSVQVENIGVKSFRLLMPVEKLQTLAKSTVIVSVHVCECYLIAGDQQKCALEAVTKAARQVQLAPQDAAVLGGRIFMLVEDPADFAKIHSALNSAYPPRTPNAAWRIMHDNVVSAGGTAGPPSRPPSPPSGGPTPSPVTEKQNKKPSCEVSPSICFDPKKDEASAELELKCEGLPTFVFSTEGKAGVKVGPFEVSLSRH